MSWDHIHLDRPSDETSVSRCRGEGLTLSGEPRRRRQKKVGKSTRLGLHD